MVGEVYVDRRVRRQVKADFPASTDHDLFLLHPRRVIELLDLRYREMQYVATLLGNSARPDTMTRFQGGCGRLFYLE